MSDVALWNWADPHAFEDQSGGAGPMYRVKTQCYECGKESEIITKCSGCGKEPTMVVTRIHSPDRWTSNAPCYYYCDECFNERSKVEIRYLPSPP